MGGWGQGSKIREVGPGTKRQMYTIQTAGGLVGRWVKTFRLVAVGWGGREVGRRVEDID